MPDIPHIPAPCTPAGTYRWVVLAASFLTMITTASSSYASGIFHVALLETFPDVSITLFVWAGSLFSSMYGPAGFLSSALINTFDCRTCVFLSGVLGFAGFSLSFFTADAPWLLLTYGVLGGLSIGLSAVGSVVVLGFYFGENTNIATCVALTGQGLGIFVHPPLIQYLINTYGVRGTFLVYGGIAANGCGLAMLMKPSPLEKTAQRMITSGQTGRNVVCKVLSTLISSFRVTLLNGSLLGLTSGYLFFGMSVSISYLYLPEFLQTYGESKQASSFLLAISGISNILSRVVTGILTKERKAGNGLIFTSVNGIIGIIILLIRLFTGSTIAMLAFGFLLGLYTGSSWVVMSPLCLDVLGLAGSASGIGFMYFGCGAGHLTGPVLSRLVFEATGDYYHVFVFAVFLLLVAIGKSLILKCIDIIPSTDSEKMWLGVTFMLASVCGAVSSLLQNNGSRRDEQVYSSTSQHLPVAEILLRHAVQLDKSVTTVVSDGSPVRDCNQTGN